MICTKCGKDKPEDQFHWRCKAKGKRERQCKECRRTAALSYYESNKAAHVANVQARNRRVILENIQRYSEYLREHPCMDCGETDIIVLEPDHVGEKKYNISKIISRSYSWDTIFAELQQCEIVCSNCHARRTAQRGGWRKLLFEGLQECWDG